MIVDKKIKRGIMTNKVSKRHCLRCEHDWTLRIDKEPKCCPGCHSPYWNVPKKKKVLVTENIKV